MQESVDLSAFAGNASVAIDFRLFATTVVNRAGWYIDDVAIQFCGGGDADLQLDKTSDAAGPVDPGDSVVYTLTVTNNGPADATGVVVTDTLPMGVTYVSDDCGGSEAGGVFTWNVGALANGANAACNVTVTVDAGAGGDLVNMASVTADNSDPTPANNSASTTVTVGGASVLEIPTLGAAGLALLALLLAAGAALLMRRRAA